MMSTLSDSGYREGENLNVSSWSIANSDGLAKRAWLTEKERPYDAIFLNGTVAAQNFKQFAFDDFRYKFVFASVTDPIGIGLINNFENYPPSNFTGICYPVQVRERLLFIKKIMPESKTIGLIYADMPQSISYRKWLEEALATEEFSDLNIIFRSVEFIQSEEGHRRMTMLAEKYIQELDSKVDLFLSPNDQMGVQAPFAEAVYSLATKPLVGLGRKDVMESWGATMSIFPSLNKMGEQAADMIQKIFEGHPISEIKPLWPEMGMAFDLEKAARFNIVITDNLILLAGENIVQ
jgi:putative ABC transport system substrate-binding protein